MLKRMGVVVTVNGEALDLEGDDPVTIAEFVHRQAMREDRVAVEWNGAIVSRQEWATTVLRDGDRLEVVHFVGGGAPAN